MTPTFLVLGFLVVQAAQPAPTFGDKQKVADAHRAEIQRMLTETRATDAFRLVQIGGLAAKEGLTDEMFQALDLALAANADREKVDAVLAPAADKELSNLTGSRRATRCQEILKSAGAKPSASRTMFASRALSTLTPEELTRELGYALSSPSPTTRKLAVEIWGASAPAAKWDTLYKRSLVDGSPEVRDTASKALAKNVNDSMLNKFARGLGEKSPTIRVRSAEALGNLGQLASVPALVKHLHMLQAAGTSYAPRAFFSSEVQQAYVSDYNVEVAQASAIAEPVVSTLQSGAVLDVRVLGADFERVVTLEKQAAHDALVKIAGADLGNDPKAWARWYNDKVKTATEPPPVSTPTPPSKN
jgi:hypothetical protein